MRCRLRLHPHAVPRGPPLYSLSNTITSIILPRIPPRFPRILLCVKHCLSRALVIAARHIMSVGQRVSYKLAGRNFYWNWIFYVDFGDFGAGRPRSS